MPGDGFGRLWRWPLYTPRRFFSVVLVLVMLVALSNMIFGHRGGTGAGAVPASDTGTPGTPGTPVAPVSPGELPTTAPAPTTAPLVTVSPVVSPRPPAASAAAAAGSVAEAFTRAWANHNRPAAQWLADVTRYADPEFAAQLGTADPANVPANSVTGPPSPIAVNYASASVEVPTDAGKVILTLINDGHSWLVTDIRPAQ